MRYVVACSRKGYKSLVKRLNMDTCHDWFYVSKKGQLSIAHLRKINPIYVFFPHWFYIIPEGIYTNFECVMFRMTVLPFGRGGSPLQNLITRVIYETQTTAFRCEKGLDT